MNIGKSTASTPIGVWKAYRKAEIKNRKKRSEKFSRPRKKKGRVDVYA